MSTQIFSDNFTRSNTSPGGVANGWVDAATSWEINSDAAFYVSGNGDLLRPTGTNVGSGQPENPVSGMVVVQTAPGSGEHTFYMKFIDSTHYIRADFNNTGSLFNLHIIMDDGSGETTLYSSGNLSGGPTTTSVNVSACKLNGGKLDLYLDVRDAGAPGAIIAAIAITAQSFSGAASNGQLGYRPFGGSSISNLFTSYVYDVAIGSAPSGTNSGSATNLPSFGSALTAPGLTITTAGATLSTIQSGSVPITVIASSGGTGTVTYTCYYSDTLGTAPGSMTALSGQTGTGTTYSDTTLSTAGAVRQYCVKAVDSASPTPGVQYSHVSVAQIPFNAPVILLIIGESVVEQLETTPILTDTYTSNAGNEAARLLSVMGGGQCVILSNQAQPSTTSAQWVSGQTNLTNAVSKAHDTSIGPPRCDVRGRVHVGGE